MLIFADTGEPVNYGIVTLSELNRYNVSEETAAKLSAKISNRVIEVVNDGYFECDTVYDYTPTPSVCNPKDTRHLRLRS